MWIYEIDQEEVLDYPRAMSEAFELEEVAPSLEKELDRELAPKHPLKGCNFKAIAKSSEDPNEFLFETDHVDYPVIKVHLTWNLESDIKFPNIENYEG